MYRVDRTVGRDAGFSAAAHGHAAALLWLLRRGYTRIDAVDKWGTTLVDVALESTASRSNDVASTTRAALELIEVLAPLERDWLLANAAANIGADTAAAAAAGRAAGPSVISSSLADRMGRLFDVLSTGSGDEQVNQGVAFVTHTGMEVAPRGALAAAPATTGRTDVIRAIGHSVVANGRSRRCLGCDQCAKAQDEGPSQNDGAAGEEGTGASASNPGASTPASSEGARREFDPLSLYKPLLFEAARAAVEGPVARVYSHVAPDAPVLPTLAASEALAVAHAFDRAAQFQDGEAAGLRPYRRRHHWQIAEGSSTWDS
jgi:hypothetical protein